VIEVQALEDRLYLGRDYSTFVVTYRFAGPIHQLQMIRQAEANAFRGVDMFTTMEGQQVCGPFGDQVGIGGRGGLLLV